MNGEVFESWFGNKLIPNLLSDRKTLTMLDNAKYYCRLIQKTPSVNMRKKITIQEPIPTKPVLLSLIREANVPEQYIVDIIAKTSVCSAV